MRNHASTSANVKPITKAKFIDRLIRSKLMTAEDVAECESTLESVQAESDALSFAHAMVRANKLTGFQAKAICDGRIKGLTFGEYIILDRLGKGGMGIVYKAKHRRMDRLVAIKVLPRSTMATKGLEERFYREVKTAAKLMHPNIVAALDASEDDGLHYLVMEYVDGQDLGEVLRQSGPLQGEHAVNCIIQAARGLQYAHEQGVIHRDIKPANLLIDGNGTVKVLDMGLARVTGAASEGLDESSENDSAKVVAIDAMRSSCDIPATLSREHDTATINDQTRLTNAGEIMGTLAYMPPEQFTDSRNVDERGDIYSLGCTLYHLLTGQKPFHADTVAAIFKSHRSDPVPSLRSIRPDIPEDLDRVFQRMLAKEPEQRQSSMLQVIEELGESLSAMQRPQTIPVGPSQKESSNRELYTNTFGVASSDSPAGSPQIVLSHDHPVRRGRRNRLGWISAGMAVCALLLIGVLMFVQKSGQGKRSLASSTSMNLLTDATDMHKAARMTAKQHPQGNISAKLPTHHDVDGRINRPQDIEDEVPNVNDKNPKEFDNPTQQSNQNAVDNRVGKPMDWIGGTTWSTGFEFQEGSSFGPSANRQVEFNDSGRKVSISEDSTGITVTVDGRVVKAANVAELSKKDAQAFQLYEKVFGVTDMEIAPAISAFDLQRMQLERLRETHSENPQLKSLIERMLPDNRK
ncbi:MAG: protein kinase [Planctomycetales bacterium]|nr:protein kinase [Planctomycetales bacterium]